MIAVFRNFMANYNKNNHIKECLFLFKLMKTATYLIVDTEENEMTYGTRETCCFLLPFLP